MKLLKFKKKYQSGGMIGGGSNFITMTNRSTFKPRQSGILLQPAPIAQFPGVDKSKITPDLDGLFGELKGKGHTNEVNKLYEMKQQLDRQLQGLTELEIIGNSDKYQAILQGYAQLASPAMLNELIVSKERTKSAYEDATKKGITGQYAIKEDAIIVRNNKNQLQRIPLDKLYEYQSKGFVPVSVQELNDLRDYVPELAGNYELDAFLNWGVNGEQLRSRVREAFSKTGHSLKGHDGKTFTPQMIEGSLYELTQEGGYKVKRNYEQLLDSLNGLKRSLTQEELDTMKGNATLYLMRNGLATTPQNISAMVNEYLVSVMKGQVIDEKETKQGVGIGKELGGGGGSNRGANLSLNELEATYGDPTSFDITLPSGMTMHVRGSNFGHILHDQGPLVVGKGDDARPLGITETRVNEVGQLNKSRIIGSNQHVPPDQQFAIDSRSLVYTYTLKRKGTDQYLIGEDSEVGKKYAAKMKELEKDQGNYTKEQQEARIKKLNQELQKELGGQYEMAPIVVYKAVVPNASEYRGDTWASAWWSSWGGGNPSFGEVQGDQRDVYEDAVKKAYGSSGGVNLTSSDESMVVTMFAPARPGPVIRGWSQETKSKIETPGVSDDLGYMQQQQLTQNRSLTPGANRTPTVGGTFNNNNNNNQTAR